MSIPSLPLTDNIQKCFKPPDCLLDVVTQPTDSRVCETTSSVTTYPACLLAKANTCLLSTTLTSTTKYIH